MAPAKTAPEPGPKPDFLVVENSLKCQTGADGEISLNLLVPLSRIELFMDMGDLEIEQKRLPRYLIDNIMDPADKSKLEGMKDGAKAIMLAGKFAEALGDRMGADMGESKGSTESSASTVEPSATTSAIASE